MVESLPPRDLEAERAVLGAMMRYNDAIADIALTLRGDDFYDDGHQRIFRAILALWDRSRPVDTTLVADELKRRGELTAFAGEDGSNAYSVLGKLWESAATGSRAVHHAGIVRDASLLRQLARCGNEIASAALTATMPASDVLEAAERSIYAIAESGLSASTVTLGEILPAAIARIDERAARDSTISGLSTGFAELDAITAGLQQSELVILAARPSVGKTALALGLARNAVLDSGASVFFATLEQAPIELAERLLARESGINAQVLRRGALAPFEWEHLGSARDRLLEREAGIYFTLNPGMSVTQIAANARRLKRRHDIKLVLIDYLQLVMPDDRRASRNEQVGGITRRLKHLARELALPVVALAQLNRESESRTDKRPRLSDLRDSGEIEQHGDTIILLHRPDDLDGVLELNVAKQRNGPTGDLRLLYEKPTLRFSDLPVPSPFPA